MSEQPTRTGLVFSSALHGTLLAMILVGFSSAPRFDDASESIPVETITQEQFNQIMKGERDAPPARPAPAPPAPKEEVASAPPTPPDPPPELKHLDDPTPPDPPAPLPSPKPDAAKAPPEPPEPDKAEVVKPKPAVEPKAPPTPPEPPTRPKTPEPPKAPALERPKVDNVAKLLEKTKTDDPPKQATRSMDLTAIAKIIGTSKQTSEQVASATPQGLPTQNAPRMSPSLSASLDGWLTDAYLRCWSVPPTMPDGEVYVPIVKVAYNSDGSLSGQPVLVNPPPDRAWTAYAESAKRAVQKCNPLHVPPQYSAYYEQWRTKTVHFDPRLAEQ